MPLQQLFRFFAPIASEVCMKKINHRPEVASLFHIHLKKISQIVKRWRSVPQQSLLLHRRWLRISLRHDQPPERRTMLPRNLLPHRLAHMIAKSHPAFGFLLRQKNPPPVIRHLHVIKCGPAFSVHADRSPQIHTRSIKITRAQPMPPVQKFRLPMLQRALQAAIRPETHVIGNAVLIIRFHHTRSRSNFGFEPLPNSFKAPCSPVAFGRIKIQFCQAESLPNILVCKVSAPGNRRLASIPVSASGERLARSSIARRISSSQSKSSGATVTRPNSIAFSAANRSPIAFFNPESFASLPLNRVAILDRPFTIGKNPKFAALNAIFGVSA